MKLSKLFWVVLIFVWAFPEFIYMAITKEPSKIAKFICEKLKLWD